MQSDSLHRSSRATMVAASMVLVAQAATAGVFTVNRLFDDIDPNPGDDKCGRLVDVISGARACTLRAAIQEANASSGSVVIVPAGTYELTLVGADEDLAATGDLDILAGTQVEAAGGVVVIDANGLDRVIDVHAPQVLNCIIGSCVSLEGLTLRGGVEVQGGGLRLVSGTVTLLGSAVLSNQANIGGGIYVGPSADLLEVRGSVVRGNSAVISGGGIFNAAELELSFSTITGNSAPTGGGLVNGGLAAVELSTISGNAGSGVLNDTLLDLSLHRVTLSANQGAAIENANSSAWSAYDSLIDGGCSGAGALGASQGNLESPGSTCGLSLALNQVDVEDPGLAPLAGYGGPTPTHALMPDSPARNAGLGTYSSDQRLAPVTDGFGDTGSFEHGALPPDGGIFSHGFESGDTAPWSQ